MTVPVVSVLVTTYNHERFVAEAIESILAQEDAPPFEVVVGVDASADRTLEIVRALEVRAPGRLQVHGHADRVGLFENFRSVYQRARGKWIALLEGDDYWTDQGKLRAQIAHLERNPSLALCGHSVDQRGIDGERRRPIPEQPYPGSLTAVEFIGRFCDLHTSSLVFPEPFGRQLPTEILDERTRVFDLPLKILLSSRGGVGFVPRTMSVFRRVPGSASADLSTDPVGWRRGILQALRNVRPLLDPRVRRAVDRQRARLAIEAAYDSRESRSERRAALREVLRVRPIETMRLLAARARGRLLTRARGAAAK